MPLYSLPKNIYIGLQKGAKIEKCEDYKYEKPVVYYGSSITQGGCASRPGMAYTNILTRELNVDHINLGFSGSARGEDAIAEYISGLDMSVFVYAQHNKEEHGTHVVLLARNSRRGFDSVLFDLCIVLLMLAMAYAHIMITAELWGIELPHL